MTRPEARSPALPTRGSAWRNPLLWTLQGWLALFYLAAAYAKLTEPVQNLEILMQWPAWVERPTLQKIGVIEAMLALGVASPVLSSAAFRPVMLLSTVALLAVAAAFGVLHAVLGQPGLVVINGVLAAVAGAILWGRWPAGRP